MSKILAKDLIEFFSLEIINNVDSELIIDSTEINRCGLQLTGFYTYFVPKRIQIVGKNEWSYFDTLSEEQKKEHADDFLSYELPMIVFTRGQEVFPEFIESAKKYNRLIVRTDLTTTIFMSRLTEYLEDMVAPTVTIHGVFVDVYGVGVLIKGKSGIGKSETALELVKRGHRFISDDAILIKRTVNNKLIGKAPELIKNFLEIRGIGILNVASLYGMASIRHTKFLDLVIELEDWEQGRVYDRLGLEDKTINILDIEVSTLHIPVKPGRNLAVIIEAAATNHRQKRDGTSTIDEIDRRIKENE